VVPQVGLEAMMTEGAEDMTMVMDATDTTDAVEEI